MKKALMPDLIVLLPGITGSQLRKDGAVVWGLSGGALANALFTRGGHLRRALTLDDDAPDEDDLGDGITADRLMPDLHLLPGFWKIDGYGRIADAIRRTFQVEEGHNFVEFPYDWRRDNRVAARRLQRESAGWLKRWRERSGNPNARLILVAHSMGGLVSRYFLEVLGGWKDTRALVTFGTPFRGSLNALDTLVNGMKKGPFGLMDLSEMARSFTSIYQLLPLYRCYDPANGDGSGFVRLTEAGAIPYVDRERLRAARAFHQEIEDAVHANAQNEAYRRSETGYRLYPFVGIAQQTAQAARREGSAVRMLHAGFDGEDRKGDGTVPRVSAVPQDYAGQGAERFSAVQHGSIQNADGVHTGLEGILTGLYFDLGDFLSPAMAPLRLGIEVEDVYLASEPVVVRARPDAPSDADVPLVARLRDSERGGVAAMQKMEPNGEGEYVASFGSLPSGAYVAEVNGGSAIEPAAAAFAVADLDEAALARTLDNPD